MKKFLVLLLGALMVLGFATVSFAVHDEAVIIEEGSAVATPGTAFVFGGDARVRGIQKKDHDLDSDSDIGEAQFWDQRVRFTVDAKTMGGVEVRTRMTLSNEGNSGYAWGEANSKGIVWDWGYIHFPVGPITVDVGNQRANWGYKFFVWDSPADRLKLSGKFGNVRLTLGTDKVSEATGDNNDVDGEAIGGDYDKYFGAIGTTVGDWDLNLLYISYKDARPTAADSDCTTSTAGVPGGCPNTGADENGAVVDLFVTGKAGPVGIHIEYVAKSGDLFETMDVEGDEGDPWGGYFAVTGALGPVNAFAAYAVTRDGYVADNDFAPTLLVGTVQGTAMFDYGALGLDFDGLVVGGTYPINDAASISARYAAVKVTEYSSDFDGDGESDAEGNWNEFNVQADYNISKNLTYTLAYGSASLSGDVFDGADNPSAIISMVNMKY